jgi:hypothetical protein
MEVQRWENGPWWSRQGKEKVGVIEQQKKRVRQQGTGEDVSSLHSESGREPWKSYCLSIASQVAKN